MSSGIIAGLQWPTRPIRQSCNFDDEQKLQAFIKVVVQRLTQPLQQPMEEVLQRLEKMQAGGDRKVVQGDAGASGQKPHAPIILERPNEIASSFFMVR